MRDREDENSAAPSSGKRTGLDAISLAQPLHNDRREMRQLRIPRRPFRHTLEGMQDLYR